MLAFLKSKHWIPDFHSNSTRLPCANTYLWASRNKTLIYMNFYTMGLTGGG